MGKSKKRKAKRRPHVDATPKKVDTGQPAAEATPGKHLGFGWALAIFGLAVAVRLLVVADLSKTVLYSSPQLDHLEFLQWARSIADGAPIWMPSHAPGYPFFLGTLLVMFDGSVRAARAVQSLMGGGLAVLTALLGVRFFSRGSGIAAGLLVASYGPLVFIETGLLAEGLFVFLLTAALYALTSPRRHLIDAALAGLLLGLSTIVRATGIVVLPAFLLIVLLDRPRQRRAISALVLVISCLIVVLPVAKSFGDKFDSGLFLQGFGGLNFLLGNDPAGEGVPSARLGGDWDVVSGEAFRSGALTAGARERYYYRQGLEQIRQEPLGFVRMLVVKGFWLTQAEEPRETHSIHFFRTKSLLLRLLPGFGLLFPLSVCGLLVAGHSRRLPLSLSLYLLTIAGSCMLFVVSLRYRLPVVPVLAVFAGLAIIWFWSQFQEKAWRKVVVWVTVFLVTAGVSQVWSHAPTHNLAEEVALSASSLERDGDLKRAESMYKEALELDPQSAFAWAGLGRTYIRKNDLAAAEEAFRKSLEANPDYSRAHGGLGAVQWMTQRPSEAVESYRRALWLSPDTGFIARDLGKLLAQQGQLEEALEVYEQFLLFDPNDVPSLMAVARLSGALNAPHKGLDAVARATDLDPGNIDARALYALLSSSSGDFAAADRALRAAESRVGTNDPRLLFAWSVVYGQQGREEEANQMLARLIAEHPEFDPQRDLLMAH